MITIIDSGMYALVEALAILKANFFDGQNVCASMHSTSKGV